MIVKDWLVFVVKLEVLKKKKKKWWFIFVKNIEYLFVYNIN